MKDRLPVPKMSPRHGRSLACRRGKASGVVAPVAPGAVANVKIAWRVALSLQTTNRLGSVWVVPWPVPILARAKKEAFSRHY